jgi:hypothetical protein
VSSRCNATGTKSSSENSNASSTYSQDDAWDISFYADPHVNPEYDPTAPVDAWDQYLAHISNIKDRESMFQLPPIASRPCPTKRTVAQRNHESPIPSPHQPPPPSALKPKPIKTVEEVTMRWKIMRSPFSAHLHNYFCPFWQHGDRRGFTRSQCPKDETFNLFHVNPFTKSGRAHREWLDRRDAGERMRREYEKGCDEEVVGEASSALPET